MSSSNCCFLTCIQISQEAVKVVWYSHLLQNFPQFIVIHTVKGFGSVNKAEIDVFSELSCCLDDPRKDQYIENCKALMKEIKDTTDRWRNLPCSWIRMINILRFTSFLVINQDLCSTSCKSPHDPSRQSFLFLEVINTSFTNMNLFCVF